MMIGHHLDAHVMGRSCVLSDPPCLQPCQILGGYEFLMQNCVWSSDGRDSSYLMFDVQMKRVTRFVFLVSQGVLIQPVPSRGCEF